jgi:large subunit ribosomal protein L2
LNKSGGRNNQGRLTAFRKGGGHKRKYRQITFKRNNLNGVVEAIEHDPNRSAFIARLKTDYGNWAYILAPQDLQIGQRIESGERAPIEVGNALPLRKIPIGSTIHNIELEPGRGGQFLRAAGAFGQLVEKMQDRKLVRIKLISGEQRLIHEDALATLGVISNIDNKNQKLGKAGRNRWLGKRPVVRGVAMNPVDHPHGGGEGKTSGGRHPVTPWGRLTKGPKTRRTKRPNPFRLQDLNRRR